MKTTKVLVLALAILLASSVIAFAYEHEMKQESMMSQGMKAGKMKKTMMYGTLQKMMMAKQMVATKDGGVIVLLGNKLLKYDKNLNLVKETEIKIDFEAMNKMIQRMSKECPMYKEMVEQEQGTEEKKE